LPGAQNPRVAKPPPRRCHGAVRWINHLPNILTISRVPMMFIVVALMFMSWRGAATIAFWLFIAAALSDWLDGLLARNLNIVSPFGRFMDAVIDKVMIIGLMIALVNGDYFMGYQVPAMLLLLLMLSREFAISGLRMAAATKGIVVEADTGGKVKAFFQFNAIGWLMGARMLQHDFGDLFPTDERWIISLIHWAGMAWFGCAAVLTVTSGVAYFKRHWRVVM
jgi:CDP-diacylglycerol--glycerol-3-phosphate 3-phosphatidyltransferase